MKSLRIFADDQHLDLLGDWKVWRAGSVLSVLAGTLFTINFCTAKMMRLIWVLSISQSHHKHYEGLDKQIQTQHLLELTAYQVSLYQVSHIHTIMRTQGKVSFLNDMPENGNKINKYSNIELDEEKLPYNIYVHIYHWHMPYATLPHVVAPFMHKSITFGILLSRSHDHISNSGRVN